MANAGVGGSRSPPSGQSVVGRQVGEGIENCIMALGPKEHDPFSSRLRDCFFPGEYQPILRFVSETELKCGAQKCRLVGSIIPT